MQHLFSCLRKSSHCQRKQSFTWGDAMFLPRLCTVQTDDVCMLSRSHANLYGSFYVHSASLVSGSRDFGGVCVCRMCVCRMCVCSICACFRMCTCALYIFRRGALQQPSSNDTALRWHSHLLYFGVDPSSLTGKNSSAWRASCASSSCVRHARRITPSPPSPVNILWSHFMFHATMYG